jgi:hypothetical protein
MTDSVQKYMNEKVTLYYMSLFYISKSNTVMVNTTIKK